jgi:hypothetical protein
VIPHTDTSYKKFMGNDMKHRSKILTVTLFWIWSGFLGASSSAYIEPSPQESEGEIIAEEASANPPPPQLGVDRPYLSELDERSRDFSENPEHENETKEDQKNAEAAEGNIKIEESPDTIGLLPPAPDAMDLPPHDFPAAESDEDTNPDGNWL